MSELLKKLKRRSTIQASEAVNKSKFFQESELTETDVPALNIILSGKPDGGFGSGLTILGAPKAHFKTGLALILIRSYLNKHPDSVCIFYDSEFGGSLDYMVSQGVDTSRVLHSPIESIEALKFDMVKQLDELEDGDKVIFLIDSLGMIASNKETEDALSQKSVADMTKAKELASFARLVTPKLNTKGIPCIAVNHVYKEMSLYGGNINSGGEKLQYAANTIIHISKSKEKEGKELKGFTFRLIANKSRFVRENASMPFNISFDTGINKWSGMFDLALELGWIVSPKMGWYNVVDKSTGELLTQSNVRRKDIEFKDELWKELLSKGLSEDIYNHFSLNGKGVDFNHVDLDDETEEEDE